MPKSFSRISGLWADIGGRPPPRESGAPIGSAHRPFRMEYRMISRDGRVVWFLDQATVVPGQPGRPGFHHGFLLDITERKQLEGALAESTEELGRQKRYFESLLQHDVEMVSRSRGALRPRFAGNFPPSKTEGAGNAGCALHPRSHAQCAQKVRA